MTCKPPDPQLSAKVAHLTTGLRVKEGGRHVWSEAWPSPCPRTSLFQPLHLHRGPLGLPGARPMTWGLPPGPAPALPALGAAGRVGGPRRPPGPTCRGLHPDWRVGTPGPRTLWIKRWTKARGENGLEEHRGLQAGPALSFCPLCSLR